MVIAIFFNTFVNPIALESLGWKYYFVFVVVLIIMGFTVYFFYPETKGYTLENIAILFDGEGAAVSSSETVQRAYNVTGKNEYSGTLHEEKI